MSTRPVSPKHFVNTATSPSMPKESNRVLLEGLAALQHYEMSGRLQKSPTHLDLTKIGIEDKQNATTRNAQSFCATTVLSDSHHKD